MCVSVENFSKESRNLLTMIISPQRHYSIAITSFTVSAVGIRIHLDHTLMIAKGHNLD